MSLVIGTILAFAFLEWPWRAVVILSLAAIEAFEIAVFLKWRKVRSMTGAEGIIGATGRALTPCDPEGQVKVKGQIWRAHCEDGVAPDDEVVVTGTEGIRLVVAPR